MLRRLHPLEICHLPQPLLSAAVDTYSDPAAEVDLSAYNQPQPIRWEQHCQFALSALRGKPIASLRLSHVDRVSASYLRDVVPQVSALSLASTHAPPILSFLPQATTLTELTIASQHEPRASLLDALFVLPHLQHLSLRLHSLPAVDRDRLGSFARLTPAATAATPVLKTVSTALAPIAHASLVCTGDANASGSTWPALLSCLLDFSALRTLTCFPPALPRQHALYACTAKPPPRLVALTLTPDAAPHSEFSGASSCADGLAAAATAAAAGWAPLTRLALQACGGAAELLFHLPLLRDVSLLHLQPPHCAMLQKVLPHLEHLQALQLSVTPAASDHRGRIPAISSLLRALQTLPLTRLSLSNAAPTPESLNAIQALTRLEHLTWVPHSSREEHGTPAHACPTAVAGVLQSCTSLTTISLPWPLQTAGFAGRALTWVILAPPRWLQHLELRFDEASPGLLPPAQPATELELPALQALKLHISKMLEFAPQMAAIACWRMRSLTLLHIKSGGSPTGMLDLCSSGEGLAACCHAVEVVLQGLPRLQELELPPQVGQDSYVNLGPALQRLTRLERLVLGDRNVHMSKALLPYVRDLPLRRGIC